MIYRTAKHAEMRLAAERLKIRVLQPGRAGLLIAQPLHVLEQMHARHQPRRQTSSPLGLVIERPKRVIEPGPVDQFGQPQKLMFRINNRLQGAAEKGRRLAFLAFVGASRTSMVNLNNATEPHRR